MDDGEYAAAFDALDTIKQTLERHWMRKPEDAAPAGEPSGVAVEIEVEGDPVSDVEELTPPMDEAPPSAGSEPLRVTEFMGPRKGSSSPPPPPPPQEPAKRKRGRPPKARY